MCGWVAGSRQPLAAVGKRFFVATRSLSAKVLNGLRARTHGAAASHWSLMALHWLGAPWFTESQFTGSDQIRLVSLPTDGTTVIACVSCTQK
jgi:hypothetical protein